MSFKYLVEELKLEISGKVIELGSWRRNYPYTPQGSCQLEELRDVTGITFPKYVDLFVTSEKHLR